MTPQQAGAEPCARDPVEELAEVFLERFRRGERPALSEFIARAPEHADEIRELFPALVLMENADLAAAPHEATTAHAACHLERLGDYRLLREVGRGGMGIVYEAEQETLGRHVALKILPLPTATDPRCLLRFRREARSAARLHHTNIVPVFDIGERDGVHYYAMQFIQGQGLDEVISELRRLRTPQLGAVASPAPASSLAGSLAGSLLSGQFRAEDLASGSPASGGEHSPHSSATRVEPELSSGSPAAGPASPASRSEGSTPSTDHSGISTKSDFHFYRSVAQIGLQVAAALSYAHGQRVLHRDIKPSNLLLDACGIVWVTDFGLAKEHGDDLTRSGDVVGTLRYLAPERLSGVSEARSDVYSLGLTLYELLTLQPAFAETDRTRLVHSITTQEPTPPRKLDPHVPRDLETIILKAIAKEPARRYATAAQMEEDLRSFLMDRPIRARRTSTWERVRRWCRRNPGWAATTAAVLGLLLLIAIGGSVMNLRLKQALRDVQAADADKTEKLRQSYVERARALRSSGRVGQRFEALKAIREAAKIKVTDELRDEAVAALVLPDVELAREWEGYPEGTWNVTHDANFQRYARITRSGEVTVCRLTARGEEVIHTLAPHGKAPFKGIWMSPDGRFLAYGHSCSGISTTGGVRVWKLDGTDVTVCLDESSPMHHFSLAFHPDSSRLAIGHTNGTISIHDLESSKPPQRVSVAQAPNGMAFHPHKNVLAAACSDTIRLIDLTTGKELQALRNAKVRSWSFSLGLAWHPNGRLLAAVADFAGIHLWDTETATETMPPLAHNAHSVCLSFNRAGDRLLSRGWDEQTRLWDLHSGRLLLTMSSSVGVTYGRDEAIIGLGRSGSKLQLWRVAEAHELGVLRRPSPDNPELHNPVIDTEGRVMATATATGFSFFELRSGKELAWLQVGELDVGGPRNFHKTSGWLTGGSAGVLRWPLKEDPDRPNLLRVGPPLALAPPGPSGCASSSDGRITVVPQYKHALLLDRDRPGKSIILGPQFDVRNVAVSPDGKWAATFSWWWDPKNCCVWDTETGRHVIDLPGENEVHGVFSPDGRWLAVGSTDRGCQLFEVGTWKAGKRFEKSMFCWSGKGEFLIINDVLGVIRFVEPATGREVLRLAAPGTSWFLTWSICISPDGTKLIGRPAESRGLYVWDLRLIRKQLRELDMDWDLPEFPPEEAARPPLTMQLDPGFLRPRTFNTDHEEVAALSLLAGPFNPEAHLLRGLAHERLRDRTQAIQDLEMFLALTPVDDKRRPEIHVRLAKNHRSLKDATKALAALAETMDAAPELIPWPGEYAGLCNDVAWHQVKMPRDVPDVILRLARRAVEFAPYDFSLHNTLGVALYRAGQYEEATRCLEKSLADSGEFAPWDLYFLAMSHHHLGDPVKARSYLDRANAMPADARFSAVHLAELAAFRAEAEHLLGIADK